MRNLKIWKNGLDAEALTRLRTWLLAGVIVCAGLTIGLSFAPWAETCAGGTILGTLNVQFSDCGTTTGAESEVVVGLGDGRATAGLGLVLLATCALALAFSASAVTWMIWATLVSAPLVIVAGMASFEYADQGTLSQPLILLTGAALAAPILSSAFVWLEPDPSPEELNGVA